MEKITYFLAGLSLALVLWFAFSWLDVISDNIKPDSHHSNLNAFVLLSDYMEEVNR